MIDRFRHDEEKRVPDTKPEGMTRRSAILAAIFAAVVPSAVDAQQKQAPAPKAPAKAEKGPVRKQEALRVGPRNLRDVLRAQLRSSDTVTIDATVAESVRAIWAREYRVAALPKVDRTNPNEPVVRILDPILKDMEPYLPALRETFKKHGVHEWCLFLTVVESKFKTDLVSEAGAVGPYQFIEETGATYGLVEYNKERTQIVRDDRTDVLKSADACARLLKDNFAIYKRRGASDVDAWKFATHQYNGSFAHLYALRHANGAPTYAGFLAFMQERMRSRLTRAREATEHVVQPGESLGAIARRNRLSLTELLAANPEIKNPNIVQPNTIIRIPALAALADDAVLTHTVAAGETLSRIARHLGTTIERLKVENKLTTDTIAVGQRLTIPADAVHAAEIVARNKLARLGGLVQNLEYTLKLEGLLRELKSRGVIANIPS